MTHDKMTDGSIAVERHDHQVSIIGFIVLKH